MAHPSSPSHRSSTSQGSNTLVPPESQRRMTSPASSSSLSLPESIHRPQSGRPPSPLRNGFVPDTSTGILGDDDDDDDDGDEDEDGPWGRRSASPASSVSQLAASFAHRVGTLVSNISSPRSPGTMPTDAEIEADAQRERDRSRREAERILTAEAEERRMVEERVLAMIDSTRGSPKSLPYPSRSQTLPNPPSPSPSSHKDKDGAPSWWIAAKNRLTPTKDKEPLTPAQQVIQDAKLREKDKRNSKGKEKETEWPVNPQGKYTDPAFLNLNIPSTPPSRRAGATTPSPTPSRPSLSNMPPNLSPSPMRMSADGKASPSPSRELPPMYAQFNAQGTLDVPGTLLTIAKRFEKLEKWTVGHVRALEERMSDVERWLVDKEKEKEEKSIHEGEPPHSNTSSHPSKELDEMKEHVEELQGRVGALGREMAKLAAAAAAPSSGARVSRPLPQISPQTSPNATSIGVPTNTVLSSNPIVTTPHTRIASSTAFESTSPPMTSAKSSGRTRLPYPTGDYATPPDSSILAQGAFSPTNSPPSSITSATRARPVSISGLPSFSQTQSNTSGLPITTSPTARVVSPSSNLPPPKSTTSRNTSVSPTPRKRYTVALGAPLNDPSERSDYQPSDSSVFSSRPQSSMGTAFFSSSPVGNEDEDESATTKEDEFDDETIGKSSAARLAAAKSSTGGNSYLAPSPSPSNSNSNPRIRAQSIYGLSSLQPPPSPITPLRPRVRSRSTDRFGLGISVDNTGGSKFVDPLVLRKQEQGSTGTKLAMPKPVGKIPIGQLVAFFDGEKKDHN